jgi:transposase InsO family protein
MEEIGLSHRPKHRPNGITRADREASKSEDLLKRDFKSREPLKKCITDITEIKARDGKLYVSAIFGCFDAAVLGMAQKE